MEPKRKKISAADAVANILRFVEGDEDEEEDDDLEELYDEEQLGDVEPEDGLSILSLFFIQKELYSCARFYVHHVLYHI